MENPISKVSVALGDTEINIVNKTSEDRSLHNFSLAVRQIIREWFAMKQISNEPASPCAEEEK